MLEMFWLLLFLLCNTGNNLQITVVAMDPVLELGDLAEKKCYSCQKCFKNV